MGWKQTRPESSGDLPFRFIEQRGAQGCKRARMEGRGKKTKLAALIFTQQRGDAAKRSSCADSPASASVAPSPRPRLIDFEFVLHLGLISYLHPTEATTNADEPYFTTFRYIYIKKKSCQWNFDSDPAAPQFRILGCSSHLDSSASPHHSRNGFVVHLALRLPRRALTEVFF